MEARLAETEALCDELAVDVAAAEARAEEAEGRADREAARLESLLERLMHVHKDVSAARRACEEVFQVRLGARDVHLGFRIWGLGEGCAFRV